MAHTPAIQREKNGRVLCTVTFDDAQVQAAEARALARLGEGLHLPGFRPGKAPPEMIREKIHAGDLLEETIRQLLPETLERLIREHNLQPIIPPKVDVQSRTPLTITVLFIERPPVSVKGGSGIRVERRQVEVTDAALQQMLQSILQEYRTAKPVERPAREGDRVTMAFEGRDQEGKPIAGAKASDRQVVLGSRTLIPGFEEHLIGLRSGDTKTFSIVLPENYHAEHLRGVPVTFTVQIASVEELSTPTLTDDFARATLHAESAAAFTAQVRNAMQHQEEQMERRRRERDLLVAIRKATNVDLPPELVEEELRAALERLGEDLQQRNTRIEDWLQRRNTTPEDFLQQARQEAVERLTVRFGLEALVDELKIHVSSAELEAAIGEMLAQLPDDQRTEATKAYAPGSRAREQLLWQKKVEKLMHHMLAS